MKSQLNYPGLIDQQVVSGGDLWLTRLTRLSMYGYATPSDLVGIPATQLVAAAFRVYSAQILRRRLRGEEIPPVAL